MRRREGEKGKGGKEEEEEEEEREKEKEATGRKFLVVDLSCVRACACAAPKIIHFFHLLAY